MLYWQADCCDCKPCPQTKRKWKGSNLSFKWEVLVHTIFLKYSLSKVDDGKQTRKKRGGEPWLWVVLDLAACLLSKGQRTALCQPPQWSLGANTIWNIYIPPEVYNFCDGTTIYLILCYIYYRRRKQAVSRGLLELRADAHLPQEAMLVHTTELCVCISPTLEK